MLQLAELLERQLNKQLLIAMLCPKNTGFIQQNAQLGLPLQLSQFEAALAEEQGAVDACPTANGCSRRGSSDHPPLGWSTGWIYVAADEEASSGTNAAPGVGEHQAASAVSSSVRC